MFTFLTVQFYADGPSDPEGRTSYVGPGCRATGRVRATAPRIEPASVDQRITAALTDGKKPRPFSELRASCRVRATTLYQRLAAMTAAGIVVKSADGYRLANP
ncbi:MAG: hypothetical protein NVS2B11_16420 [Acetobacteraceae bacterium]